MLLFTIAVTVDIIYYLWKLTLVLPHCFLVNLLENYVSDYKTVSAGTEKLLLVPAIMQKKNMEKYGKKTWVCSQNNVITCYDNIEKNMKEQYKVSPQKRSSPNIITLTLNIAMDSALQRRENLKNNKLEKRWSWKNIC